MATKTLMHALYFLAAANTAELLLEREPENDSPSWPTSRRESLREWTEQPIRRAAGSR